MKPVDRVRFPLALFVIALLPACAGTGPLISSPAVELTGIELTSASVRRQTFLLQFDVSNPNPFPLPVKAVAYRLSFDRRKFARGETAGRFTVPARGAESFAISVELDFLNSATHWASLMSGTLQENLSYELQGSLAVDIPFADPVSFTHSGNVNLTQTVSDRFD